MTKIGGKIFKFAKQTSERLRTSWVYGFWYYARPTKTTTSLSSFTALTWKCLTLLRARSIVHHYSLRLICMLLLYYVVQLLSSSAKRATHSRVSSTHNIASTGRLLPNILLKQSLVLFPSVADKDSMDAIVRGSEKERHSCDSVFPTGFR